MTDEESAPEWPTTELWELDYLLYVVFSFRLVADPPAYLDPGPTWETKIGGGEEVSLSV